MGSRFCSAEWKLKRKQAERFPHDRDSYIEGKGEFIEGINSNTKERWALLLQLKYRFDQPRDFVLGIEMGREIAVKGRSRITKGTSLFKAEK